MNTLPKNDNAINLLFVDDEKPILASLQRLMHNQPYHCRYAGSGAEALDMLAQEPADIIISDMKMPQMNGAELFETVSEKYPDAIRIILSGHSDNDSLLDAINKGRVWGYISKPWDNNQLLQTLLHAYKTREMLAERSLMIRTINSYETSHKSGFQQFIGSSIPMHFLYASIQRAAPSSASVMITGSSGTGKELAASAIHQLSKRQQGPFIALNCAAIPSELMESEIFGHIKGAFSGAVSNRDGAATLADGGTLFLDELTEMDIGLQAKLLRFIQTGTFQKVGSSKVEQVDIRFVCATNRNPLQAIADKKLREDLYYRLNVIPLQMPDLKDREGDPLLLAHYFLQRFNTREQKAVVGFSKKAEERIVNYPWPGNVRELENCIHNAVVMAQSPLITEQDLQFSSAYTFAAGSESTTDTAVTGIATFTTSIATPITTPITTPVTTPLTTPVTTSQPPADSSVQQNAQQGDELGNMILPLAEVEKRTIMAAIELCNKNVVKAAGLLDVSPSTLYRKMQGWEDNPL